MGVLVANDSTRFESFVFNITFYSTPDFVRYFWPVFAVVPQSPCSTRGSYILYLQSVRDCPTVLSDFYITTNLVHACLKNQMQFWVHVLLMVHLVSLTVYSGILLHKLIVVFNFITSDTLCHRMFHLFLWIRIP